MADNRRPETAAPKPITDFGKIGVLMGGPSTERDISLKSGKAVLEALQKLKLDAVGIDIKSEDHRQTAELIRSFGIDCAFVVLHGRFGEDGQIQSILEGLRLRYTGSGVKASSTAMDKISAKKLLREKGLPVAEQVIIEKRSFDRAKPIKAGFKLPWVIKPAAHGSSIGLSIADSADEVLAAIDIALGFDDRIMIEEYIKGREMTVGILQDQPLCVIEIVTKNRFFDFQAKYQNGFTEYIVPAQLPEDTALKARKMAQEAHRSLGCSGFSRVDIMLDDAGRMYILEVNTIPGLTSSSLLPKAAKNAGIDFEQLCLKLLKSAYEKE
jgi:D-alanine-D-alanine ligase